MMSWKPEVQTDDTGQWYGNGLAFETRQEAEANAHNLMMRWTAVRETRAVESAEPVNYRWTADGLEAVVKADASA